MGHSLTYDSFDPYDGDEAYKCPCCGERYYSWDLSKRGIKHGESFKCDRCKILLTLK